MKIYKKIIVGFITFVTIMGLMAFYFPVRNLPQPQTSSESTENYSASLNSVSSTLVVSSSSSSSSSTSSTFVPTSSDITFKDMSGFSDLGQENDLIKKIGTDNSNGIKDVFEDLNK